LIKQLTNPQGLRYDRRGRLRLKRPLGLAALLN
jgi:hypothetical protein